MKWTWWLLLSLFINVLHCQEAHLYVQRGHQEVASVAFSPDGRRAMTACWDSVQVWDLATGKEIQRLEGGASSVRISPNGRLALIGNSIGQVRIWDLVNRKTALRLDVPPSINTTVAFSSDGGMILATSVRSVYLFDSRTGKQLRRLDYDDLVLAVAFSPDDRLVLIGTSDHSAHMWNSATGKEVMRFVGHSDDVTSVAFSPDGRRALTGSRDHTARVWDARTGLQILCLSGHSDGVSSVAFFHDGHRALTGGWDNTARIWSLDTGEQISLLEGSVVPGSNWYLHGISSVAVTRDDSRVLTGSLDRTARLWDVQSVRELRRLVGESDRVFSVVVSPDDRGFVSTDGDPRQYSKRTVRWWDAVSGDEKTLGEIPDNHLISVGFVGDNRLAIVEPSGPVDVHWLDLKTRQEILHVSDDHGTPSSISVSNDGHWVIAAVPGFIKIWNSANGTEFKRFPREAQSVAISADGRLALTVERDIAHVVNVNSGADIHHFPVAGISDITETPVALTQDGRWVLTSDFESSASLWDTATGDRTKLNGHTDTVRTVAFSSNGALALTGSDNGTVEIWDVQSRKLIVTLVPFTNGGWAVVSPDGRFDTSELDGGAPLSWIVSDDPLKPLPLEIFMRQYYTPRLLPRLLAHDALPKLPSIASLNRIQPTIRFVRLELDPNHIDALRAVVSVNSRTEGAKSSGARDLRIFRDGQLVDFREGNLSDGEYVFDNIRLAHKGPKQEVMLTAYAFNRDFVKSETAKGEPYKVPADWPERQGRVFLVNIGVNRTSAEGCDLHYTVADATTMQSMLTKRLQDAGYGVEQHLLVSDDTHLNGASKSELESVLREISQRATPDDLFVLSYSGHGYTDKAGEFYLFPSDLKGNCRARIVDRKLLDSAISSDKLTDWIRPIDAGEMVMILDACYSAEIVEGQDFKPGPMGSRGLGQLAYDKRIRVLAASQAKQPAGEAGRLGMGYLSYALLKDGLENGQADWQPKDNSIWLREWLAWGVKHVPDLYSADPSHTEPTTEKGFQVNLQGTLPLQTPALFDFRTDQDQGVMLQKQK